MHILLDSAVPISKSPVKLDSFNSLDCRRPFLHQYSMPTIRTTYATVFIINLYCLLASSTFVGHLFRLQGLSYRPNYRAAKRCIGHIRAACKGITTLGAIPYCSADSPNSVPPTLGAIIESLRLIFDICHQFSGFAAIPRTKPSRRSTLPSFLELLDHNYSSRNFSRITLAFSHAISTMR